MLEFFDANCVFGRSQRPWPSTTWTEGEFERLMGRFPISRSLVADVDSVESAIDAGNARIAAIARSSDRVVACWGMPMHTGADFADAGGFMTALSRNDVGAVRVNAPNAHGYLVDEWALGPVWRELERARVPVLLANSELSLPPDALPSGISAANVYQLAQTFPDLPLIVLRLSGFSTRVAVPLLKRCPNVHVELSYYNIHRGIELLVKNVGARQLLYGSNLPWSSPGAGIAALLYADISEEDQRAIAHGNLTRLIDRTFNAETGS